MSQNEPAARQMRRRGRARGEAIQPDSSQPSHLRWNDPQSELPVLIVINLLRGVTSLPCGATVAQSSCSRFPRYQMTVVVFHADNPHVSYLERTPAEKPGHDVVALPGVLPNFQPLVEREFERNAAEFGAMLVLTVFLLPFDHVESYWLRMVLTRCRRRRYSVVACGYA
jgi:hypothetical protein